MRSFCVIPQCKNITKKRGVSFFMFPAHTMRRLIWTVLIRKWMKDPSWTPDENSRICSDHFEEENIYKDGKGRRRLVKYAVPQMVSTDEPDYGDDEDLEESDNSDEEISKESTSEESNDVQLEEDKNDKMISTEDDTNISPGIVAEMQSQEKITYETEITDTNEIKQEHNNFVEIEVEPMVVPETSKIHESDICVTEEASVEKNAHIPQVKKTEEKDAMVAPQEDKQPEVRKPVAKRKTNEVEKFKRRIIRAVARKMNETNCEEEIQKMWESMKKESKCDCKLLWERMRALTLKKLKRLLPAEDRTDIITNIARLTATDWLLFDLVLVHEKIDVIGQDLWAKRGQEPDVLYELLRLVEVHKIECLSGTNLIDAWLNLTKEYNESDRKCSPMMLQRRWFQMKSSARERFYRFWDEYRGNHCHWERAQAYKPTDLQISLVRRYREIVVMKFLDWPDLIAKGKVILAQEFDDRITEKRKGPVKDVEPDLEVVEENVETIEVDGADSDNEIEIGDKNKDIASSTSVNIKEEPCEMSIEIDEISSLKLLESINIPCETPFGQSEDVVNVDNSINLDTPVKREDVCKNESNIVDATPAIEIHDDYTSQNFFTNTIIETPFFDGPVGNSCGETEINSNVLSIDLPKTSTEIPEVMNDIGKTDIALPKITNVTSIADLATITEKDEPFNMHYNKASSENLEVSNQSDIQNKVSKIILETIKRNEDLYDNIELPSDIQFADDGIVLVEEDEDSKNFGFVKVKDEIQEDGLETNTTTDSGKIDLKLLLCPTVYTKKLDHMDAFKFVEFDHIRDKRLIECAILENKPISPKDIKNKENAPVKDVKEEEKSDSDEDLINDLRNSVSLSSWLLKKPRVNNYNPIQLCKNPDFNTRLKRLTAGFFTYELNRRYLKECKPMTIDLHKSFETKLVNNTLRLRDVPKFQLNTFSCESSSNTDLNLLNVSVKNEPESDHNIESIEPTLPAQDLNKELPNVFNPASTSNIHDLIIVDQLRETRMNITPPTPIISSKLSDNVISSLPTPKEKNDAQLIMSAPVTPPLNNFPEQIQTGQVVTGERKRVVNLPDINEVRRTNQKLLCAEVAPIQSAINSGQVPLEASSQINNTEIVKNVNINESRQTDIRTIVPSTVNNVQCRTKKPRGRPITRIISVDEITKNKVPLKRFRPLCRADIPWIERVEIKPTDALIASDTVDKMLRLFCGESLFKGKSHHSAAEKELGKVKRGRNRNRRVIKETDHQNESESRKYTCCWARKKAEIGFALNAESHLCPKNSCICCCKYLISKKSEKSKKSAKIKRRKRKVPVSFSQNDPIVLSDDEDPKPIHELEKKQNIKSMEVKRKKETTTNLEEMATKLEEITSNLEEIPTNLEEMATNLEKTSVNLEECITSSDNIQEQPITAPSDKSTDIPVTLSDEFINQSKQAAPRNCTNVVDPASLDTNQQLLLDDQNINVAINVTIDNSETDMQNNMRVFSGPSRKHVKAVQSPYSRSIDTTISATTNVSNETKGINVELLTNSLRNSTNPSSYSPQRPVFLGKKQMLLCTKSRPKPQTQKRDATSFALPTGVNFVMFPNKEIALSIDPGVELNAVQIQELENVIKALQTQLTTLPIENLIMKNSDEVDIEKGTPPSEKIDKTSNVLLQNDTEQTVIDDPEDTNDKQMDDVRTNDKEEVKEINSVTNNSDSLQTITENKEANDQSTNVARKTLLSDLMELSGISEEDAQIPDAPNPNLVITLDPINVPFLKTNEDTRTPTTSEVVATNYITAPSALAALASRPDLQILTSYSDLREAHESKSSFYKLDIETGKIFPVNVCIKKNRKHKKPPILRDVIDLTDESEVREDSVPVSTTVKETSDTESTDTQKATPVKLFRSIHPSILRHGSKGMSVIKTNHNEFSRSALKKVDAKNILKMIRSHKQFLSENYFIQEEDFDKEEEDNPADSKRHSAKRCLRQYSSDESDDEPLAKIVKRRNELTAYSVTNVETANETGNNKSNEEMTLLEMPNDILMDVETNPELQLGPTQIDSDEDCILGV